MINYDSEEKNLISGKTAITDQVDADTLLIWDATDSTLKKITRGNFLKERLFRAYVASNTGVINSSTYTLVPFGGESYDPDSTYTNTASNYKFTPAVAGYYLIGAHIRYTAIDLARVGYLFFYVNGVAARATYKTCASSSISAGDTSENIFLAEMFLLDADDYVQVYFLHDDPENDVILLGEAGGLYSTFWGMRVSP